MTKSLQLSVLGNASVILLLVMMSACGTDRDLRFSPEVVVAGHEFEVLEGSSKIADGTFVGRAKKIVLGPSETIFIADVLVPRVLRLSLAGELVEVIGREGDGPGEFREPIDILCDIEESLLWVFDRGLQRIALYSIADDRSVFVDQISGYGINSSSRPRAALASNRRYWLADRWAEQRITLFGMDGSPIRSFGDLDLEPGDSPAQTAIRSAGTIQSLANSNLLWLWDHRPFLELWSENGELIRECTVSTPEIDHRINKIRSDPPDTDAYPSYITGMYYGDDESLYLAIPHSSYSPLSFYEYDIESCSPLVRYSVSNSDATVIIRSFVVVNRMANVRIIAINELGGQLLKYVADPE